MGKRRFVEHSHDVPEHGEYPRLRYEADAVTRIILNRPQYHDATESPPAFRAGRRVRSSRGGSRVPGAQACRDAHPTGVLCLTHTGRARRLAMVRQRLRD